ncbi:MAG: hypothetical protein WC180_02835 [Candidatus Paceibacterota bacterium]
MENFHCGILLSVIINVSFCPLCTKRLSRRLFRPAGHHLLVTPFCTREASLWAFSDSKIEANIFTSSGTPKAS